MKKFFKFISKYNIIYFLLIFIIVYILFEKYKYNIYSPYSDIGRELYIPSQAIGQNALYGNVFMVYAPLGYILNGLITKCFSNNINVFFNIGLFFSVMSLIPVFLISNIFNNKLISLFITMLVIFTCTFFPSVSNWITPYSYSMLIAMCTILWAMYYLLKYIKYSKDKYIILSSLLYGLSICTKYEFIFFILLIIGILFYKKASKSLIGKCIGSIFTIPILTSLVILFQGISTESFFTSIKYIIKLSQSNSVKYFYTYNGFIPSKESILNAIYSTKADFIYIFENINRYILKLSPLTDIQPNSVSFRMSGYLCIILTVGYIITLFYKKHKIRLDIMYLCLSIGAILTSIKCIGSISFEIYGTFFFPLIIITIISFLTKNKMGKIFKRVFLLILLSVSLFYFLDNERNIQKADFMELKSSKGIVKIKSVFYEETKELISYITKNTTSEDSVLIIPEGTFINYLTDRKSDNKLYYLIPPNTEIFTDEEIINDLKKNPPKLIIFHNLMYKEYAQSSFKNSYGKNIYDYVNKNFNYQTTIGNNNFKFYIYKI